MIGLPRKSTMFFRGRRLDPPRAGMIATALKVRSFQIRCGNHMTRRKVAAEARFRPRLVLVRSQSEARAPKHDFGRPQALPGLYGGLEKYAPSVGEPTFTLGLVQHAPWAAHGSLDLPDRANKVRHFGR